MIDAPSGRALALHEARVHAGPRRELRHVEQGVLLHDPLDPEPFWNRLVAPDFPRSPGAFDRRLAETLVLFGTLARYPHVRPLPARNRPLDLALRLLSAGFEVVGEDQVMALRDASAARRMADAPRPAGVTVERVGRSAAARDGLSAEIGTTLAEAFGVDASRAMSIERDARATIGRRGIEFVVIRIDGVAATVAKRTSLRGTSYLSSIGSRPSMRRRGFGRLATAVAVVDAINEGDRLVHLATEADNHAARAMYGSLGFQPIGEPVADLLLRP